jgi:hypothetical protein
MANMELITSVTVGSGGAASVTLPATGTIPQTYTDLYLVMSARSDRSGGQPADGFLIKPNNTTPTIKYISGEGSGTAFSGTSYSGIVPTISATASTFGSCSAYFPNYANTSNHKSFSVDDVSENNGTIAYATLSANLYSSNSAITTIVVESINAASFVEHSTFYLYGISNVTSTTKATGGIVSSDGTYNYHMFPYSGTFTPTEAITVDYLVVAGGGGGSYGGGGAGGLRSTVTISGGTPGTVESALSLTAQAYTVTVGAGGAAGSAGNSYIGQNGSNSVFSTITSTGGGGAAYTAPAIGGSGGGRGDTGAGAAGTANQGFAGGAGTSGGVGAGGGGGAGAVGGDGTTSGNIGGNGGNGRQITAFANPTQTGTDNGYYAGGGGGGYQNFSGLGGLGGLGGGGKGTRDTKASAGVANTGGGGAGSYAQGTDFSNGGSGIVIIRYAI